MITISKIVDSAALAVTRLASQFKNALKLNGMVVALSNEAQAVEDALWDLLLANRDHTVATGATMDNIGDLIGAPVRGTRNDASYRRRITGQIIINKSNGESASIYAIAKNLVLAFDVPGQPKVRETGPAEYTLRCDGPTAIVDDSNQARELAGVLAHASSAGVRSIVFSRSNTVGASGFFRFAGAAGPARGFGVGSLIGAYDR